MQRRRKKINEDDNVKKLEKGKINEKKGGKNMN